VEQEVGGSSPPNCTSYISSLRMKPGPIGPLGERQTRPNTAFSAAPNGPTPNEQFYDARLHWPFRNLRSTKRSMSHRSVKPPIPNAHAVPMHRAIRLIGAS
ncbi:hypothetical protein, partial [Rhodopseudomonas palustris]|uniref:hypothetical protein n=1 Tax=Rhodopseudomonas palustris TaxID=1076 RepID=UPI001AEBDC67